MKLFSVCCQKIAKCQFFPKNKDFKKSINTPLTTVFGKTAKSIVVSLCVRLSAFNMESIRRITAKDNMHLSETGFKKTAIFVVIPDNDASLSYLVGMLYTQLIQEMFYQADRQETGCLPRHVRMLLDEFANIPAPYEFEKALATMRSRNISATIILQNLAQLKTIYPNNAWETITGNCDTLLYLGGNEQSTHEYISKLLGKQTIETKSYSDTSGRNGHHSTNTNTTHRELLDPSEVRMLDNKNAILFVRGFEPVMDTKYDLTKHRNYPAIQKKPKNKLHRDFTGIQDWNETHEIYMPGKNDA